MKNKRLYSFKSFSNQEEDNYRWLAGLTPEQHLINAIHLIKRIYAKDLSRNPRIGNKITFK
jgi:hypothetical protein